MRQLSENTVCPKRAALVYTKDFFKKADGKKMEKIDVFIVYDEPVFLQKLMKLDWGGMGLAVAGTARSMEQARLLAEPVQQKKVLMDFREGMLTGVFFPADALDEETADQIRAFYQYQILPEHSKAEKRTPSVFTKKDMQKAVAYIEEHLQDSDLSIVDVAAQVYLNPVYFGRMFQKTFHMKFKQYLLRRRMEIARMLLESSRETVGSISVKVGISNPSYFSRRFKEYTGKLPSEYRER